MATLQNIVNKFIKNKDVDSFKKELESLKNKNQYIKIGTLIYTVNDLLTDISLPNNHSNKIFLLEI